MASPLFVLTYLDILAFMFGPTIVVLRPETVFGPRLARKNIYSGPLAESTKKVMPTIPSAKSRRESLRGMSLPTPYLSGSKWGVAPTSDSRCPSLRRWWGPFFSTMDGELLFGSN